MREKRYIFIGTITEMIFNKELFPRNKDLHEYINLYEALLGIDPYKDYLYKSRTTLAARVVKDLFFNIGEKNNNEKEILKKAISEHLSFIDNYFEKVDTNQDISKKKQESTLLDDIIKSRHGDKR